jgi:platelet-activating factor acetylhydrolase IB subunit alpha
MVGLTPKQQEELNLAILEYLRKKEWNTTADNFVAEAKITKEINTESNISTRLKTG